MEYSLLCLLPIYLLLLLLSPISVQCVQLYLYSSVAARYMLNWVECADETCYRGLAMDRIGSPAALILSKFLIDENRNCAGPKNVSLPIISFNNNRALTHPCGKQGRKLSSRCSPRLLSTLTGVLHLGHTPRSNRVRAHQSYAPCWLCAFMDGLT